MDLKTLLGDAYKDGMTIDEINSAIANKKLADLDTGNYVLKDNADATARAKEAEIQKLKDELKNKMTDEEKLAQTQAEKDKQVQELQDKIAQLTKMSNQSRIESALSEIKGKLELKDDKEYNQFISNITSEDESVNNSVSAFLAKFVKQIYEKGSADATKAAIGKNNKVNTNPDQKEDKEGEEGLGARLAKKSKPAQTGKEYNYFA